MFKIMLAKTLFVCGGSETERDKNHYREMLEHITGSEIAGYAVGALLLSATISAPKIDNLIASSQRSSLGMCKKCGDLKLIACKDCRGCGVVKEGGFFGLNLLDDYYQYSTGGKSKIKSLPCVKCRSRGHFPCPQCK